MLEQPYDVWFNPGSNWPGWYPGCYTDLTYPRVAEASLSLGEAKAVIEFNGGQYMSDYFSITKHGEPFGSSIDDEA